MTSADQDGPILIAGGGIGGLSLARALALRGRPSIVLEQAPEFGEIGAGIQLGPNVDRMFARLGVQDEMRDIAFYPRNLIMKDSELAQGDWARGGSRCRSSARKGRRRWRWVRSVQGQLRW